MRVAAIDCGTNSVRLLLADVAGARLTRDECAAAVLGGDGALRLEAGVDRPDRVGVHAAGGGHLADAGQPLAGLQLT